MLPLDHVPFYGEPDDMAEAFARLGFTVSPLGDYTAPDHPGARWPCRDVFLRDGWFDLLRDGDAALPGAPAAALFRTGDLSAPELASLNPQPPVRLERRWRDGGDRVEAFAYASLRSRIAPVGLAAIAHAWPCADIDPAWFEHANGAVAVEGLIFGGEAPGPAATTAARLLDLSGFEYWPRDVFDAAFPRTRARRAVRVRTAELAQARACLSAAGVGFQEAAGGLCVPAQAGLLSGFLFCA